MSRENITDILCIGCQKGSTSWLHSVLSTHPRTFAFESRDPQTSTNKEAHFWDWNRKRGVEWYSELMTPPDPAMKSMDFTPEYALLSPAQIAECKELNPTAKVIYILRDPLARAVSAIRMHMLWRLGKEHSEPLHRDEQLYFFARNSRMALHGDYLKNLKAWRKHYPDLILLNYEDFHTDRTDNLRAIFSAIGLDLADADQEALKRLMRSRIWESEKFALDHSVLMFLNGLTWRFRLDCERELGMRFAEGEHLLHP